MSGARGTLRVGSLDISWGARTYILGIMNATSNSFSGDGCVQSDGTTFAVSAAAAISDGADLVDVGGVPLYAGAELVTREEELGRVVPAVKEINAFDPGIPISVDTSDAAVARRALECGASMINSAWGLRGRDGAWNRELAAVVADFGCPLVLTHNADGGTVVRETYGPRWSVVYDDVVGSVESDLRQQIDMACDWDIPFDRLIVDPGPGLGKSPEDSLTLVRHLDRLSKLGAPILLAHSRKSFLGRLVGAEPSERDPATAAATALGVEAGADLLRVHNVRSNKQAALVADAWTRR